jgi:glycosyltransferase involved in cell wall biosynthesis
MRVLQIHNRYQIAGGEDVVVASERALLEAHGHTVEVVGADNADIGAGISRARTALRTIYSPAARRQVADAIARFRPDIVHVHNFFPLLSPSVYLAAGDAGIPVVQTLHNYRLICPAALCYRDGRVCEDCVGNRLAWPGIQHACYRNSRPGTAAVAAMLAVHRLWRTWDLRVDCYVALTEFARSLFIGGGLPAGKIVVKPNFVHPTPTVGRGGGGFALYVGRLSTEKGLEPMVQTWQRLGERLPLKIVGDGPWRPARIPAGVSLLGHRSRQEVMELMREAMVLVFPSVWYEGFPVTIAEAFAVGLPVIASNLGSMAMIVKHRQTGRLFRAGDPADLAAQVEWMLAHPAEWQAMRRNARAEFEAKYTAERNYEMLMEIYRQAL